jgi:outer membrane protein TolC
VRSVAILSAVALVFGASAVACAQQAATPQTSAQGANLPSAPSAVLSEQDEALAKPAGSGYTFTAPHTIPGPGDLAIEQPKDTSLAISMDDAISLGIERNANLRYERAKMKIVKGEELSVANSLMPSLKATASTSAQEINLTALGFKPQSLGPLLTQFGINPSQFPTIVKVDVTQVVLSADQRLFDLPAFELYKGAKREADVVDIDVRNSEGDVVYAVATAYLKVLADQSTVANAHEQERAAKTLFDQAVQERNAGTGTNLDALRGQVEYQQRQQGSLAAQNQLDEDIIQLNRIMGLPAGQRLELTDTTPLAEFDDMDRERAMATAFRHRKDYLSLEAQIDVAEREVRAVRYQRLPTVAFNGFYGVVGQTTGLYHGAFTAEGTLKFPIFREAAQRGEQEQVSAQLTALREREADLKVAMDAQIRSSMLDVQAADQLVKVGQSNVALAQQELADEQDRFKAGVDDNLPVVDAEASVTGAQAQLVQALYQYNVAKLQLARNTGVVESRYRVYLGK